MELYIETQNVRCDIGNCRNNAKYTLSAEGVIARRRLHICEECAREMYSLLGRQFVPKSPENVIKKSRSNR